MTTTRNIDDYNGDPDIDAHDDREWYASVRDADALLDRGYYDPEEQ